MNITVSKQRLTNKKQLNNLTNKHKTEKKGKQTIIKWEK